MSFTFRLDEIEKKTVTTDMNKTVLDRYVFYLLIAKMVKKDIIKSSLAYSIHRLLTVVLILL